LLIGLDPQRFTKNKPWADYCESEAPLKTAIHKLVGRK
jgi:hypothetical protein